MQNSNFTQSQEAPLRNFRNGISAPLNFGLGAENYKVFETIAVRVHH